MRLVAARYVPTVAQAHDRQGHGRATKTTPTGEQVVVRYVAPGETFGVAMAIGLKLYRPPQPRMGPHIDRPQQEERPEAVAQDGGGAGRVELMCQRPAHPNEFARGARGAERKRLLLFPVGIELLEKGEQVVGLLLILQAGIDHLGARDFRLGVLDVFAEGCLIPGDSGVLVGG